MNNSLEVQKAKKVLSTCREYIDINPNYTCLDGNFTAKQLAAICVLIKAGVNYGRK